MDKDVAYIYDVALFSHEKQGNPAICNNVGESWGHYDWNKLDRDRQILYDCHHQSFWHRGSVSWKIVLPWTGDGVGAVDGFRMNQEHYVHCALYFYSLVAQLVKNLPAMQETPFDSWVRKLCWRRDRLPTPVFLGLPGSSADKESTCNVGDLGLIPGLGRSPGEGEGYPL